MAKYDPLHDYLRKRRRHAILGMGFADIERVIGAMLPNRAMLPQWWENRPSERGHVQCRAWREAGYDALLLEGDRVVFTGRRRR
mgnify:CR=1 FL=1